jgi:hypothetical protein
MLENKTKIENFEKTTEINQILKKDKNNEAKKITTNLTNLENFTISYWIKKKDKTSLKSKIKKSFIMMLKQDNKIMMQIYMDNGLLNFLIAYFKKIRWKSI